MIGEATSLILAKATTDISTEATEGIAFLLKHGCGTGAGRSINCRQLVESLFDQFGKEITESTCDLLRHADIPSGLFSQDALRGVAVAVRAVSPSQAILVREIFQGTQYATTVRRQDLAFRSLNGLDGVDGLNSMVGFLRNNANNASGVDGAIYEATAAFRVRQSQYPQLGTLRRVAADGAEETRKIDAFTDTHALQMKPTGGTYFTPSMIGGTSYLDEFKQQAIRNFVQPVLIINKPINDDLSDALIIRQIEWLLIPNGL